MGVFGIFEDFFIGQFFIVIALLVLPPVSKYVGGIESLKYNFLTKTLIFILSFALTIASPTILSADSGTKSSYTNNSSLEVEKPEQPTVKKTMKVAEKKLPVCDGEKVTSNCELEGVKYLKYIYYPAVAEKSHMKTITTTTTEIAGYCTLCNDGTRSPSCSTGGGTCSHHGGIKQANAPIYKTVYHTSEVKLVDSPAVPERYEKVLKQ